MCIRRETREKARESLAFSPVSKPHTHITYMLRQCTCIVYILAGCMPVTKDDAITRRLFVTDCDLPMGNDSRCDDIYLLSSSHNFVQNNV